MKKRIATLKRIVSLLLSGMLVLSLSSCKGTPTDREEPFYYETVYCTDVQATTEIAVVDGKLYCKWLDVQYDENGIRYETERIDVIENIAESLEWKRVSIQCEVEMDMPFSSKAHIYPSRGSEMVISYFDKVYTYPLYEEIGRFAVLTDEHNNFYLLDTETGTQIDLQLNLEDWRSFATDNTNYFAILSAFADGECKHQIRIYTLSQN